MMELFHSGTPGPALQEHLRAHPQLINLAMDAEGTTPLLKAVTERKTPIVRALVEAGADLEITDRSGKTPLSAALERNRIVRGNDENDDDDDETIANLLLDAGANPTGALLEAFLHSRQIARRLLLASFTDPRIDVRERDYMGKSVLFYLLESRFADTLDLVSRLKSLLDEPDPETGNTPLMDCVESASNALLKCDLLLRAGANPHLRNAEGDSALLLAIQRHRPLIAKRLLAAGANPDEPNEAGETALTLARARYPPRVVEDLFSASKGRRPWKNLYTESRANDRTFLAKGAFGATRKVSRNGTPYAVKRVHWGTRPNLNGLQERSRTEMVEGELDALAQLSENPYVVRMVDYESNEENGYIVMELLQEGCDLFQAITEKRLTDAAIRPLVIELLKGLASIHAQGLLHLDIKPDNIWWFPTTNSIKYLDLGLAHSNPYTGPLRGAVGYRQSFPARWGSQQDKRSDFFSLAETLKDLLRIGVSEETKAWVADIQRRLLLLTDDDNAVDALMAASAIEKP